MMNFMYILLFLIGVMILLRYRFRIEKAVVLAKEAVFPMSEEEFSRILIPNEWKEMKPLQKNTRTYKWTHWGTIGVIMLLAVLLIILMAADKRYYFVLNMIYLFVVVMYVLRHPGNLFLLKDGIIIDSKFYRIKDIKRVKVEQIFRWHPLYGLHERINGAYKLEFYIKRSFIKPYVVIEDRRLLEKITQLLIEKRIPIQEWSENTEETAPFHG